MKTKYPEKRELTYVKQIALRVEPELFEEFERLKRDTKMNIPEAQRIVLRQLAQELKADLEAS